MYFTTVIFSMITYTYFTVISAIHEKIFVCFMVTSVAYMLFGTVLFKWSKYKPMTERVSMKSGSCPFSLSNNKIFTQSKLRACAYGLTNSKCDSEIACLQRGLYCEKRRKINACYQYFLPVGHCFQERQRGFP